jgi:P63C domain
MAKEKVLKATHIGEIDIHGSKIPCAVLEDGTRVITQREFLRALGRSDKARGKNENDEHMPAFLRSKSLKPFIPEDLLTTTTPIVYIDPRGGKPHGYKAELLPKVCQVFLDAREAGALNYNQHDIAKRCEILLRGLAVVGITGLIDEATGYQEVRDRLALQAILEKYLDDEWSKWTKRFPEEYYKQIFRLRGIPYPPTTKNRPSYIGHWTNDIVYKRLQPGILKRLKDLNPKNEKGNRPRRHHQYFTDEYGVPELKEHIANVVFLMKSCSSWEDFKRRLNRASPKHGDTLELGFPEQKGKK